MQNRPTHRGERLKQFFDTEKEQGHRVNLRGLMRQLGHDKNTVYNWFTMPDLPDDRIRQVARHYPDVQQWFPELNWGTGVEEPNAIYNSASVPDECRKYITELKDKYTQLLEEHAALMKAHLDLLKTAG